MGAAIRSYYSGGASVAYHLPRLYEEVGACLLVNPRTLLSGVARHLKVERHTIERAVRTSTGKSFRGLQTKILSRKGFDLLIAEPVLSIKEIAVQLGFKSGQALCHFMKRTHGKSPKRLRIDMKRPKPARTVT